MFYAVKVGRKTGIFKDWTSAEKQVKGFKGAIFKKFKKEEDAKNFLEDGGKKLTAFGDKDYKGLYNFYIDGSYMDGKVGAGIIVTKDDVLIKSVCFNIIGDVTARNVVGELNATCCACAFALKHNLKEIVISYDYEGVELFATGLWKAKTELTKKYYEFMQKVFKTLKVNFVSVTAHTNVKFNEMADEKAKEGCTCAKSFKSIG